LDNKIGCDFLSYCKTNLLEQQAPNKDKNPRNRFLQEARWPIWPGNATAIILMFFVIAVGLTSNIPVGLCLAIARGVMIYCMLQQEKG
jgi:hypothetical protein